MKTKPAIIALLVVAAAIGLYTYLRAPSGIVISTDEQLKALNSPAPSGNFSLPQVKWLPNGKPDLSGPIEYKVSFGGSASGPTISKIVFAPYDVKPGEMQDVYVIGEYAGSVSGVTAAIKTDKGVMPLQLALAQGDAKNGVWKGSWTAKDVHPGYYTIDFTATSADGKSRGTSAAFLDGLLSDLFAAPVYADYGAEQCGIPITGAAIIGSCTLTGSDAVVNGNVTLSNLASLVIPATFAFGFSNGYSISICPGGTCSISIATGGQIVKTGVGGYNVYVEDRDSDNYWDAQTVATSNPYGGTHSGARSSSYVGGGDCYDSNANVYPSQTAYFTTNRGDGSFDYNCDATSTKQYSTYKSTCDQSGGTVNGCLGPRPPACDVKCTLGGSGATPACGLGYTPIATCFPGGSYVDCGALEPCSPGYYPSCDSTIEASSTACH